jgi:hypothetical protein
VSWDAGGATAQVYVSIGGQPEVLFAGESRAGSQAAPWIDQGVVYDFRLYAGGEHQKKLASVEVKLQ